MPLPLFITIGEFGERREARYGEIKGCLRENQLVKDPFGGGIWQVCVKEVTEVAG